jgi:hypothetical protein
MLQITVKCTVMSQESKDKIIVIWPSDASSKTTDVVEELISGIMEAG